MLADVDCTPSFTDDSVLPDLSSCLAVLCRGRYHDITRVFDAKWQHVRQLIESTSSIFLKAIYISLWVLSRFVDPIAHHVFFKWHMILSNCVVIL